MKKIKSEENRDNKITEEDEKKRILKEYVSRLEETVEMMRKLVQPPETSFKPNEVLKDDDIGFKDFEFDFPNDLIFDGEGSENGLLSTSENYCIRAINSPDFNEFELLDPFYAADESEESFDACENNSDRNYDISFDDKNLPMEAFFPIEQEKNKFDELFCNSKNAFF